MRATNNSFWIFCTLILSTPLVFGAVLVPKDQTMPPFDLSKHQVDVRIKDNLAYTKITQVYENPSSVQLEGVYIFPTPEGAKITEFSMWIAGKKMVGTVVERTKARRIYQEIVDRALDPGILEQEKRDLFKIRVFPILPKAELKFQIAYTQKIHYSMGVYRYNYPLVDAREFPSGLTRDFSFQARLESPYSLKNIEILGGGKSEINYLQENEAHVKAVAQNRHWEKDLVLEYQTPDRSLLHLETIADYSILNLTIPIDEEAPEGKTIFVLDTSASMLKNEHLDFCREGILHCLEEMTPESHFNIVVFDHKVRFFRSTTVVANEENKKEAKKYLDSLFPLGPSNFEKLFSALEKLPDNSNIILLSDGLSTISSPQESVLLDLVSSEANIFSIGLGGKANYSFLQDISEKTQAFSSLSRESQELPRLVVSVYQQSLYKPWENLILASEGLEAPEIYPSCPKRVYPGSQITLFCKWPQSGEGYVELKAERGGLKESWKSEVSVEEGQPDIFAQQYWEYKRIDQILKQISEEGESKEFVDEVIELSVKNQVVTPYTAYLVLETEDDYKNNDIDRSQKNALQKALDEEDKSREVLTLVNASLEDENAVNYAGPEPASFVLWGLMSLALLCSWRKFRKE